MEQTLNRTDYFKVGVTAPHCMDLMVIPGSKSRICVGDGDGVLTCVGFKKNEPTIAFNTPSGKKITRLQTLTDRIFLAKENEVHGMSKKGKPFFHIATLMAEHIQAMYLEEMNLYLSGDYVYAHYFESTEKAYYLSSEKINDLFGLHLPNHILQQTETSEVSSVLACADRCIRVLKGSNLHHQINTIDPVITISPYKMTDGNEFEQFGKLLYGTSTGGFGQVNIADDTFEHTWAIKEERVKGGVVCMSSFDINEDGICEIIVGRDDGNVDVYAIDQNEDAPVSTMALQLSSAVSCLKGGKVRETQEIIVSTYSGYIVGLSIQDDNIIDDRRGKIDLLRNEINNLQSELTKKRNDFQSFPDSEKLNPSLLHELSVLDRFVLNEDDASYHLSLELEISIDTIILQSDVPLDLLDMKENTAVVSFSPSDPESGNHVLATYRCQQGVTKINLKIRSIEGQCGTLQVYVIPNIHPKMCQIKRYPIKALSFHQRITEDFNNDLPFSVLEVTGQVSVAVIHSWILNALPDVPARVGDGDEVVYTFRSVFLGTTLECRFTHGRATFKSDNLSTISILEEFITREATKKSIAISTKQDINFMSIRHTLEPLHPKLDYQLLLSKKVELIPALEELKMQEGGTDFMTPEYLEVLENADQLKFEFRQQPCHLERLYGMVTDLYIDKFKYKGRDAKPRVGQLVEALDRYTPEGLLAVFENEDWK